MSSDSCINKYVRSDENIILRGFKDTVNVRLWAISMTVIVVITLMTLIIEKRKSQDITIIDSATGRMYHSRTSSRIAVVRTPEEKPPPDSGEKVAGSIASGSNSLA